MKLVTTLLNGMRRKGYQKIHLCHQPKIKWLKWCKDLSNYLVELELTQKCSQEH